MIEVFYSPSIRRDNPRQDRAIVRDRARPEGTNRLLRALFPRPLLPPTQNATIEDRYYSDLRYRSAEGSIDRRDLRDPGWLLIHGIPRMRIRARIARKGGSQRYDNHSPWQPRTSE